MNKITLLLACVLCCGVAAVAGANEPRHALVIGNSAYAHRDDVLKNAANDARIIAGALREAGFEVLEGYDLGNADMLGKINEFVNLTRRFEGLAFFYFAGHGWAFNNENFMVPVDTRYNLADAANADDKQGEVARTCVSLNELADRLRVSQKNLSMIVFDACRTDPGARAQGSATRGPVPMAPAGNVLLAFSTEPDKPAADNSGYAAFLAKHMQAPGLKISDVFLHAQIDMAEYTRQRGMAQEPLLQLGGSRLLTRVFREGGAMPAPVPAPPPPQAPAMTGHLQVAVNAPNATVWVDGRERGLAFPESALNITDLAVGEVTVKVEAEGFEAAEKRVRIAGGTWAQEIFELMRKVLAPPPPPPSGELKAGAERTFAGIEMVWIPPGTFTMGSPSSEANRGSNETQHQVTLSRGFWLGKYPVTQSQWEKVMGNNPSRFKGDGRVDIQAVAVQIAMGNNPSRFKGDGRLPVEQVSWNDAQEFIQKLSGQGQGTFRLPTEAEWEYACRAGSTTAYYFGDNESQLGDHAWFIGNSGSETHVVGGKRPNAWGLYDMHGNVWEWCQDWYGSYPSGAVTDPTGPNSGSLRVVRGGSWYLNPGYCRSARRSYDAPGVAFAGRGFRLLRTP